MGHFANLEPYEQEMLTITSEECGEIVQIVAKAMRHGIDSCHPAPGSLPNRHEIAKEIGDLMAVADMLCHLGIINANDIKIAKYEKFRKIGKYLHHVEIVEGFARKL